MRYLMSDLNVDLPVVTALVVEDMRRILWTSEKDLDMLCAIGRAVYGSTNTVIWPAYIRVIETSKGYEFVCDVKDFIETQQERVSAYIAERSRKEREEFEKTQIKNVTFDKSIIGKNIQFDVLPGCPDFPIMTTHRISKHTSNSGRKYVLKTKKTMDTSPYCDALNGRRALVMDRERAIQNKIAEKHMKDEVRGDIILDLDKLSHIDQMTSNVFATLEKHFENGGTVFVVGDPVVTREQNGQGWQPLKIIEGKSQK